MVKTVQRCRPFLALTTPHTQDIRHRLAEPVRTTQARLAGSEVLDGTLDASLAVLTTLRDALNIPAPLPLPLAVKIAVDIVSAIQVGCLGVVVQRIQWS